MFSERRETVWIYAILTRTIKKKKKKLLEEENTSSSKRWEMVEFLKWMYVVLTKTIKTP